MAYALDELAPSFRAAREVWPDAPNLADHYEDLAKTYELNGNSVIELCKSFVEMVCITIINERGKEVPINASAAEYLVQAMKAVGLEQERGSSELSTTLSAHNKLCKSLNDIRNNEGSVAHGLDGFIDSISDRHAKIYILTADTLLSLLLNAFGGVDPSILTTRSPHSRYERNNELIDESTQVETGIDEENGSIVLTFRAGTLKEGYELRTTASELLYNMERQFYIDFLNEIRAIPVEEPPDEVEEAEEEVAVTPEEPTEQTLIAGMLNILSTYEGKYSEKVSPLYDHIVHSLLGGEQGESNKIRDFSYTLLRGMEELAMVDWSERESTRTNVKLLVKKLIAKVSINGLGSEHVDDIVNWLEENITDDER